MDTVTAHGRSCLGPVEPGICWHCGGESPRGKRCCSPACARAWTEDHVWSSARAVALAAAGYACQECGALDWNAVLHVHHDPPLGPGLDRRPGCHHHRERLRVACAECHYRLHRWLRAQPGDQLTLVA